MLTKTKDTITDITVMSVTRAVAAPTGRAAENHTELGGSTARLGAKWTLDPVLGHPVLQWSRDRRSG